MLIVYKKYSPISRVYYWCVKRENIYVQFFADRKFYTISLKVVSDEIHELLGLELDLKSWENLDKWKSRTF